MDDEPLVLGAIGEAAAQRAPPYECEAKELESTVAPSSLVDTGEAARDDSVELAISSRCAPPAVTRSGGPRPEAGGGGGACA